MLLTRLNDGSGDTNGTVLLIFQTILQMLSVTSALQRIVATMVLTEWTDQCQVYFLMKCNNCIIIISLSSLSSLSLLFDQNY